MSKRVYQLTVWFKEQKFDNPNTPDYQLRTTSGKQINDYLDKNSELIRKHDIRCLRCIYLGTRCVTIGEQCY